MLRFRLNLFLVLVGFSFFANATPISQMPSDYSAACANYSNEITGFNLVQESTWTGDFGVHGVSFRIAGFFKSGNSPFSMGLGGYTYSLQADYDNAMSAVQSVARVANLNARAAGAGDLYSRAISNGASASALDSLNSSLMAADPATLAATLSTMASGLAPAVPLVDVLYPNVSSSLADSYKLPTNARADFSNLLSGVIYTGGLPTDFDPRGNLAYTGTLNGMANFVYHAPVIDGSTIGTDITYSVAVLPTSTASTGFASSVPVTSLPKVSTSTTAAVLSVPPTPSGVSVGQLAYTGTGTGVVVGGGGGGSVDPSGIVSAINSFHSDMIDPAAPSDNLHFQRPTTGNTSVLGGGLFSDLRNIGQAPLSRVIQFRGPSGNLDPIVFDSAFSQTPLVGSMWEGFRVMIRLVFGLIFFIRFVALTWLALQ